MIYSEVGLANQCYVPDRMMKGASSENPHLHASGDLRNGSNPPTHLGEDPFFIFFHSLSTQKIYFSNYDSSSHLYCLGTFAMPFCMLALKDHYAQCRCKLPLNKILLLQLMLYSDNS